MVASRDGAMGGSTAAGLEPPAFFHSNKPHAIPSKRMMKQRFRDEEPDSPTASNIMYDRRVVRGNTYQAQVVTSNQAREAERLNKEEEARIARARAQQLRARMNQPHTPPPVYGRQHMVAQTDEYLEELSDRPVEVHAETQTQAFLDRPPSPLFVPAKCGSDKTTQIEANDLFDFNSEVVPILEVLVGKTLETAFLEVLEEEELEALRQRQGDFEKLRNAELAEVQRLEAEARRKEDEKLRRLEQEKERARLRSVLEQKVAARSYAKAYLAGLEESIFEQLQREGAFYDPVVREIETSFMPWAMDHVANAVEHANVARAMADAVLTDVLAKAKRLQAEAKAEREREVERMGWEGRGLTSEDALSRSARDAAKAAPTGAGD